MRAAPSLTVLIVEPHADTAEMYAEFFRHHGIHMMTVSNAADAVMTASYADVVITNMRLPGEIDGAELIVRLRHDDQTKHTPIVVVSAAVFPMERQRAHDAGCDLFLPKPCLPDLLLREVRQLTHRSKLRNIRGTSAKSEQNTAATTRQRNMKRPA